ncbi:hypothetical protein QNO07_19910 [Streptomyces sp. 549]|uniref:hypothetical protein n=1 Tax=Streptomyces sp. 549 TaxID=3049076 RepID=UPI0024C3EC8B|nr:hypothetical protein [Streptomyces sp. 549]MDK1475653.1 hypothetical protein [Streptomyces sp. 549]
MQPYEHSRAHHPYLNHGQIPGMRPAHEVTPEPSATPIYDALYAEYRRLFRALPGDRSGEEGLRFEQFGTVHGTALTAPFRYDDRRPRGVLPAALPPGSRDGRHGL